jgi:hypothetical protein
MRISPSKLLRLLPATLVALALVPAAPAQAGRLIATGHDTDNHCGSFDPSQCHFVTVAVNYVRGGAPDPAKPLLLLDCSTVSPKRVETMVNAAGGGTGHTTLCPRDPAFAAETLTPSKYSAIVVGSDARSINFGGPADSAAINARKTDIEAFFNAGGGVLALAGELNGDDPADPYYQFVPIGVGGKSVTSPFTLTPEGQALGFHDNTKGIGTNNDINCCPTHNSFQEPAAGTALKVAERDGANAAETLFAEGTISGGQIQPPGASGPLPPIFGRGGLVQAPSTRRCVSRRRFRIRIRERGGFKIETAQVFLDRRRIKVIKRRVFARKRHTARIDLRGLPKGIFKIRIVVLTTQGDSKRGTRRYRTCTKKRRSGRRPRL